MKRSRSVRIGAFALILGAVMPLVSGRAAVTGLEAPIKVSHDLSLTDVARLLNRHGKYSGAKILRIHFNSPVQMRVTVGNSPEDETEARQWVDLGFDEKSGWKVQAVDYWDKLSDAAIIAAAGQGKAHSISISRDWSLSEIAGILNADYRTHIDLGDKITSIVVSPDHLSVRASTAYDDEFEPSPGVELGFNKKSGWHMLSHSELLALAAAEAANPQRPVRVRHDLSLSDLAKILNQHGKYFGDKIRAIGFASVDRMNVAVGSGYGKFMGGDQGVELKFDRKSGWQIQSVSYYDKLSVETITALAGEHHDQAIKISRDWSLSDIARVLNRDPRIVADKFSGIGISPDHLDVTLTTDYRAMSGGGQSLALTHEGKLGWLICSEVTNFEK